MSVRRTLRLVLAGLLAAAALALLLLAIRGGGPAIPESTAGAAGPEGLSAAGRRAVAALRSRQTTSGYWTTAHTPDVFYLRPRLEANVSVTAMIVELLGPIAEEAGLDDVVRLGRSFLRDQIERDGLVRYHGRPDAAYIRPRPCAAITPDADDTALVWRLAPAEAPDRLAKARAKLAEYRAPGGLYRTWLAAPADYECLDPGADPNPTDVAINQHLYLFFARHASDEASRLCAALRAAIDQDRIWVYYARAPIVPLLRTADLERAGCALTIPPRRQRVVSGQEPYLELALLYRALLRRDGTATPFEAVERALLGLAADDFRRPRQAPPLLYHNDLSGQVSRYYWSEDVLYALWLRVLAATAGRATRVPAGP